MNADGWRAATDLAARQHGLVTIAQLRASGSPDRTIDRAVADGRLVSYRRGIYVIRGVPDSTWRPLMGAYLAAGAGVVASHRAAAGLHALPGVLPGTVELTAVGRTPRLAGARCHRTEELAAVDIVPVRGVQATSPARTLLDLAGEVERPLLARMLGVALRRRRCTPADLERLLAIAGGSGRPGTALLREVLDAYAGGDSELEARWLRILRRAGLPQPVLQHQLVVSGRVLVLDIAWPPFKAGLEIDGWSTHRDRDRWDRDHEKANLYAEAGWRVLFATSRTPPGDVIRQLLRFISQNGANRWRSSAK